MRLPYKIPKEILICLDEILLSAESDESAILRLLASADSDRELLARLAEGMEEVDLSLDPLLQHLAHIMSAAATGRPPERIAEQNMSVADFERRLLNMSPDAAFEELAKLRPELYELDAIVSNPANPTARTDYLIISKLLSSKAIGWFGRKSRYRRRRKFVVGEVSPTATQDIQRVIQVDKIMDRIGDAMSALVGPQSGSSDPILRTIVSYRVVLSYLAWRAGIEDASSWLKVFSGLNP